MSRKVTAIVLAAGLSRRMGAHNKMLHSIQGKPMLRHVLDHLQEARVDQVVVVLGHQAGEVAAIMPKTDKIAHIHNPDFAQGMSTSISCGVCHLLQLGKCDACLICLGDMPYLRSEDYDRIVQAYVEDDSTTMVAPVTRDGRQGHPVLFDAAYFDQLVALPVSDQGAKNVIRAAGDRCKLLEFEHQWILKDIDHLEGPGH